MNVAVAAPVAQVAVTTDQPLASVDAFGFGDVYVQPAKIGWKGAQADVVAGYAFYAPTGLYAPGPAVVSGSANGLMNSPSAAQSTSTEPRHGMFPASGAMP